MTSTAVIWFSVRVPVLSELMAEVNPSVSTAGSSLTSALRLASSTLPSERITSVTVGRASGMAAMARETALTKRSVPGRAPRAPQGEHDDHRQARGGGDPQRQAVELLGQRRLFGVRGREHPGDLAKLGFRSPLP